MPLSWMSWQYSRYFGEPSGPNIPGLHDLREADDGVERRAELVADIGEELRLGAVGVLGPVLLLGIFLGELDHLLRLLLELLARLAEVGDGRHQPPLASISCPRGASAA